LTKPVAWRCEVIRRLLLPEGAESSPCRCRSGVPWRACTPSRAAHGDARTALFARYSLLGALFAALAHWLLHCLIVSSRSA